MAPKGITNKVHNLLDNSKLSKKQQRSINLGIGALSLLAGVAAIDAGLDEIIIANKRPDCIIPKYGKIEEALFNNDVAQTNQSFIVGGTDEKKVSVFKKVLVYAKGVGSISAGIEVLSIGTDLIVNPE